jgi:protein tyrosine/serine phosphatase
MNTRTWIRRAGIACASTLAAIVLVAGGIYGSVQYGGNVHVVEAGQVVRSAQLSGAALTEVAHRYGVRSVLNLRGDNAGKPWYDEERRTARDDGLAHVDYGLSAEHDVTPAQLRELLAIIDQAPKPLLIHCNAGADRTGLVSAVYELARGVPLAQASRQLSLHYGHFPYLWSRTDAMDRSLAAFVSARSASSGE